MHKEYQRIVDHSEKAILFIHGIVGTPNHFNAFVPLVPEHLSVYNMLLDGHGKSVRDFSKTSVQKWKAQVSDAIELLSEKHKEIHIVAHSMGCLLAVEQAIRDPKITKLFLLAVPLKLCVKPKMFVNALKVHSGKIDPDNAELQAARDCYGIAEDKNLLHYLGWIPRYLELFSQIRNARKMIGQLKTPTSAYQSCKDEIVSQRSGKLLEENPNITVVELKNSGHYYYEKSDFSFLRDAFIEFLHKE